MQYIRMTQIFHCFSFSKCSNFLNIPSYITRCKHKPYLFSRSSLPSLIRVFSKPSCYILLACSRIDHKRFHGGIQLSRWSRENGYNLYSLATTRRTWLPRQCESPDYFQKTLVLDYYFCAPACNWL